MSRPDRAVTGGDAALAAALEAALGTGVPADGAPGVAEAPLVAFRPTSTSDLARALGLARDRPAASAPTRTVTLDALRVNGAALCVNMAVAGTAPDRLRRLTRSRPLSLVVDGRPWFEGRATTVLVATGEFLRGLDVVPRGHPGDGRFEVQVYGLHPAERAPMRRRLPSGSHVPHPRIAQRSARSIEVRFERPWPLEVDGVAHPSGRLLRVEALPGALRVLV